jgi:uracil-DNA glycosylase family 4
MNSVMQKRREYIKLVNKRRNCRLCEGLGVRNPSTCSEDEFGSQNIGPWTDWQGNLDAELMIIGQEWDGHLNFIASKGQGRDSGPTNTRLITLLRSVGIEISLPSQQMNRGAISQGDLFLTNVALCLREGRASKNGKKNKTPPDLCFRNCATSFMRPQIELIRPILVVTLGMMPYRAVLRAFGLKPKKLLSQAVSDLDPIALNKHSLLFPAYHPGAWSRRRNRSLELQLEDWKRIGSAMSALGIKCNGVRVAHGGGTGSKSQQK